MDLGLRGRSVLVTGASRGIGRATALSLAREGANVVLAARSEDLLEEVAAEVRELGAQALVVPADVGVQADRERLAEQAADAFGPLYGFVSNSTNAEALHGLLHGKPESALWDGHYEVDVLGAVRLTDLLSPAMEARGEGSIVFISSIAGKRAVGVGHGYVAMKAALIAAGKSFALELAPSGIRVNVVAPGTTNHPGSFIEEARSLRPELTEHHEEEVATGRFSRPEEIADCIVFVLSPRAGRVVGHCLVVDGGEYHGIA